MTDLELTQALGSVSVETGSLACLGCGYKHDCCIHGCAIMRAVSERFAALLAHNTEPPNDPLTLKELRGMEGEPVWVEHNNGARQWHIFKEIVEYAGQHIICWKDGGIEPLQDYGVTWLTYRRNKDLTVKLSALKAENAEKDKEIGRLQLQRPMQVDGDVMALALELAETKAVLSCVEAERDAAKPSAEVLETIDELIELARPIMSIATWLQFVNVIAEWRSAQGKV